MNVSNHWRREWTGADDRRRLPAIISWRHTLQKTGGENQQNKLAGKESKFHGFNEVSWGNNLSVSELLQR
jgi:hypothetical protein